MRLYFPTKPSIRNQGFGANPEYYSRFKDAFGNPIQGHMGIDFAAKHGDPVYAAHDGYAHFERDSHGGEGIYLRSLEGFETNYWHLIGDTDPAFPSPIPLDGHEVWVNAGTLLGFANNTGAPFESTGDHLHFALYMLSMTGTILNRDNGFNGAIDPSPFFTGIHAVDVTTYIQLQQALVGVLSKLVEFLKR